MKTVNYKYIYIKILCSIESFEYFHTCDYLQPGFVRMWNLNDIKGFFPQLKKKIYIKIGAL